MELNANIKMFIGIYMQADKHTKLAALLKVTQKSCDEQTVHILRNWGRTRKKEN